MNTNSESLVMAIRKTPQRCHLCHYTRIHITLYSREKLLDYHNYYV